MTNVLTKIAPGYDPDNYDDHELVFLGDMAGGCYPWYMVACFVLNISMLYVLYVRLWTPDDAVLFENMIYGWWINDTISNIR